MKNVILEEILKDRIVKSDIFTEKEQEKIKKDYLLFEKCYCLGVLDKESSNYN